MRRRAQGCLSRQRHRPGAPARRGDLPLPAAPEPAHPGPSRADGARIVPGPLAALRAQAPQSEGPPRGAAHREFPSRSALRLFGILRSAGSAGRLTALPAGFGGKLAVLGERPLLSRYAPAALACDLALSFRVHRGETPLRGRISSHLLPPSRSFARPEQRAADSMVPVAAKSFFDLQRFRGLSCHHLL